MTVPTRQAPDLRHRQGRGRQVDRLGGARRRRRPGGQAHDHLRGRPAGADLAASSSARASATTRPRSRPSLFAFSIDPQRALEEYLLLQIRIRPLYELLFKNRIFTYFAAATPGLRELVTIGKVWELAQLDRRVKKGAKYDLVIVDAPATGHGLGLLRTPKTFGDIARVGPIKRQADTIYEFITDPEPDRRLRRRLAGGDAGQRDARPAAPARRTSSACGSTGSS